MVTANPNVLLEMSDEPDCRFVAAWLTKAAEAQTLWSQALNDHRFADHVRSFFTLKVSLTSQPRHSRSLENWSITVTSRRLIFTRTKMACSALNLGCWCGSGFSSSSVRATGWPSQKW